MQNTDTTIAVETAKAAHVIVKKDTFATKYTKKLEENSTEEANEK